jgi:hypothetical protein
VLISKSFTHKQIKKITTVSSCEGMAKLYSKKSKSKIECSNLLIEYRQDTLRKASRLRIAKIVILIILFISILNVILISIIKINSFTAKNALHELSYTQLLFKLTDPIQIIWTLMILGAYVMAKHRVIYLSVLVNKLDELLKAETYAKKTKG